MRILATRVISPLRLHKLRLAGELAEIRAADLSFTERETHPVPGGFGHRIVGAGSPGCTSARKAGAAGLRLARCHWRAARTRRDFVAEFSAAAVPWPSICSPKCWNAQPPGSSSFLCALPCSTGFNGRAGGSADWSPRLRTHLLDLEDANALCRIARSGPDLVPVSPPRSLTCSAW